MNVAIEWQMVPLESLVGEPKKDIVDGPFGSNLKASEYVENGVPILRLQNVDRNVFKDKNIKFVTPSKAESIARHSFKSGDVIISKLGDPLGKACIVPDHYAYGIIVADIVRVRLDVTKVLPAFFAFAVNSDVVVRQFAAHTKGTTRPRVNLQQVRKLQVPFVSDRAVQRELVDEIETQFSRLDAGITALKRAQVNLKRYRASVLKAACEGRLFGAGENVMQDRSLSEKGAEKVWNLPKGWRELAIQDFLSPGKAAMKTGPFGSLLQKQEHKPFGIPVLGIENIGKNLNFVHGSKIHITESKAQDLSGYDIMSNDVIISRSGTVGELTVVPPDFGPARFSTNLMRLRLDQSVCRSKFFAILFDGSPFVLSQVDDLCKGSTRSFLNQHILKSMSFPVPPPTEQVRIIAEVERLLSVADAVEASLNQQLIRATRLRQAILAKSFQSSSNSAQNPVG